MRRDRSAVTTRRGLTRADDRSATLAGMLRRLRPAAARGRPRRARRTPGAVRRRGRSGRSVPASPDLSALPIVGITRRRMAILLGRAARGLDRGRLRPPGRRGVGGDRAGPRRWSSTNAARHAQVAGARARARADPAASGSSSSRPAATASAAPKEIAFTLDADAPPLPADAPGSAALRVGAPRRRQPARALADAAVRPERLTAGTRRPRDHSSRAVDRYPVDPGARRGRHVRGRVQR